ncbi:hemerythrin domain-containing protein [Solimonas soli]|uniref:hemerythrin domain-containing protein n=1 Tax=Solimonas soli TaxID=413479 RepID=UPI0004879724|nr:hemerythrin domain-containing protein [Solimonas soli]
MHDSSNDSQARPRHDLYAVIHKGLRAMMNEVLTAAGRCDWSDGAECARTLAAVRELADFCAGHLAHENRFVHPAMEARAPMTSLAAAHEHVEHEAAIKRLRGQAALVEVLNGAARVEAGEALYRGLAVFVGENFVHMNDEETRHNAVLWALYSDAELEALHGALVASLTPDEMRMAMRWMLPNASHAERVGLLEGMRANAPAPVFEATLAMLRGLLGAGDWNKLAAALRLDTLAAAA